MALVKTYKSYPIYRERDGTYSIQVTEWAQDRSVTEGQFDTLEEAEREIDELLETIRAKVVGGSEG